MINNVNINLDMKMMSSCSNDGSVMIYNYVNSKVIRGFSINSPTKTVLSSSPLCCLVVYSQSNKSLCSYSING